jgi:monovalent cation:H+ antiporter-2, CPA2 family
VVVLVVVSAKWIIPSLLYQIARLRARELFILGIVFVGLGVAWATAEVGLSLALGAFLAGLIVSESEYSHRALGNVIPFRDLFTSFFFVSVGMLLDLRFVAGHAGLLAVAAIGAVTLKCLTAGSAATLLGLPLRTSLLTGLGLAHIGEFSFVLSESGLRLGLIDGNLYQLFLGVSVLTMITTPFFIAGGDRVTDTVLKLPWPERLRSGLRPAKHIETEAPLRDHLVIVGFGLNGRNLSRAAVAAGIPRIIVELNPETVRKEQDRGEPIFYGDASQEAVLKYAAVKQARVMVIVISDPAAARRIVDAARKLNPKLHIVARTRFVAEMEPLYELGADEVIPEDYEASVEMLVRVLTKYLVPKNDIERFVFKFRADHYDMLRELTYAPPTMSDFSMHIPEVEIASVRVCPESALVGKTLAECDLRGKHGVTVLAIRTDSDVVANPSGKDLLRADQVVILLGTPEKIAEVSELLIGSCGVEQAL